MRQRTVAIELKIPDNAAFTAFVALRRLGIRIAGVRRSEIWRLDDQGDPATFVARVTGNQTIFNPSKHRLRDLESAAPRPGETWIERLRADDETQRLGGKGIPGVVRAHRYVGWRLLEDDGTPAGRETLRNAVEGLLCNPAIETATY